MYARERAILALLVLLLPLQAMAQCESWLQGPMDDGMLPNGANDEVNVAIPWDPDGAGPLQERLVVGGQFSSIGGVAANNIAQFDAATGQWQAFGIGIAGEVLGLTVFNGQIVAGSSGDNNEGTFDTTVNRWNGSAWENLSATNTGSVYELHVYNGVLYIAGSFLTHFTIDFSGPAHYVARWVPGPDKWEPLPLANFGSFTGASARALETYNGALYVGGWKDHPTEIGATPHIARFDGVNWSVITNGTDNGSVTELANYSGELIIGGGLGTFLGVSNCNNIVGWNGVSVHTFNQGVTSSGSNPRHVAKITVHNGLVVGGLFDTASGNAVNNIAFWAPGGFIWQPLGNGLNDRLWGMCSFRGELIAVGAFTEAGFLPANHIARWNGTQWSPFGGGEANWVLCYTPFNGRMVAGGYFTQPTGNFDTAFNIAGWNGGTLTSFGSGMSGQVVALKSHKYAGFSGDYELIAGGTFTTAGGVSALRIARWSEDPFGSFPPPAWAAMGPGFNNTVQSIERGNGITYAAGAFSHSGTTQVNYVARWNETTDLWESMGGGMNLNGFVYAIKYFNGYLYAGGVFTSAGGVSTGGLARWNGSAWSQVGGYFLGTVYALEVHDGQLYIGGVFPGLPNGANIARYDGFNYSNVGSGGSNGAVTEFVSSGTRMYVGGNYTSIGGVSANNVAYFDGSWHDMAGGADSSVSGLGRWGNETHVGGSFATVQTGTLATPRWARWTETGTPFFTLHPYPFSQTVSIGATASFSSAVGGGFTGLSYQWFHNDQPLSNGLQPDGSTISGALSEVLTISDIVYSDQGTYHVEVTNGCGTVASFDGNLYLDATPAPVAISENAFHAIGPNPSGGRTMMAYSLAQAAAVRYAVHDLRGRLVRQVDVGRLPAGHHQAHWDARDQSGSAVSAGVYFLSIELNGDRLGAKRVTIVR